MTGFFIDFFNYLAYYIRKRKNNMTKEYEELALSYLNSTFCIKLIEYIKSRDDYPLFKNLYKLIKINSDASSVDFNKIKNMYNELFNINDVIYYPKNLPVLKYFRDIKIKNLEMISPFDVPINFINGEEMACSVEGGIVPYNNKNFRYVRKLNLTLTKAVLESYAHEIAHTQQTFISGVNDELIPIFMEIIARDYINNDDYMIKLRFNSLLNNLDFIINNPFPHDELLIVQKDDAIKYTESTLKAFMLYFIYTNEQLSSKKAQIIDGIQDCFDNKLSVREFLNRNDIKEDNYKNLSLIKQYFK